MKRKAIDRRLCRGCSQMFPRPELKVGQCRRCRITNLRIHSDAFRLGLKGKDHSNDDYNLPHTF